MSRGEKGAQVKFVESQICPGFSDSELSNESEELNVTGKGSISKEWRHPQLSSQAIRTIGTVSTDGKREEPGERAERACFCHESVDGFVNAVGMLCLAMDSAVSSSDKCVAGRP
jgi:hypothetical protein